MIINKKNNSEFEDKKIDFLSYRMDKLEQRVTEKNEKEINQYYDIYNDFDLQFSDLKKTIEQQTSRWKIQENLFYGLVLLMLFLNTCMLFWIAIS